MKATAFNVLIVQRNILLQTQGVFIFKTSIQICGSREKKKNKIFLANVVCHILKRPTFIAISVNAKQSNQAQNLINANKK